MSFDGSGSTVPSDATEAEFDSALPTAAVWTSDTWIARLVLSSGNEACRFDARHVLAGGHAPGIGARRSEREPGGEVVGDGESPDIVRRTVVGDG